MNIFALDADPRAAAQALCDAHVVKMTLETAQILSTVVRAACPGMRRDEPGIYRPTHAHHPCVVWAGATRDNFLWTLRHGLDLMAEYRERYGRDHASAATYFAVGLYADRVQPGGRTPWALAINRDLYADLIDEADPVGSYRRYYVAAKARIARWARGRPPPAWWPGVAR